MAGCGCNSPCGCIIIGDDETADVASRGTDTFIVSARRVISAVDATDCLDLVIDPDTLILTGSPILSTAPASVVLTCTPDGIAADVVVDPSSTAIVSISDDGLRVDVPPPPAGGGTGQPGDLVFHIGIGLRPGAIDADGEPVSRAGYSALHDALSLISETANRNLGDATITGIASTRYIATGMPLEATDFPAGTTVLSVDSSTQITASAASTGTGADTEVRVYPHGNGDGTTTFNTPLMSDKYPLGYDYAVGATAIGVTSNGGNTLVDANIPLLGHTTHVTDPGHDHPISISDPGHSHNPGTAGRSFVTAVTASLITVNLEDTGDGDLIVQAGESGPPRQRNNASTSSDATGITADATPEATGISVSVDNHGHATPTPFIASVPHTVGRWMVVV